MPSPDLSTSSTRTVVTTFDGIAVARGRVPVADFVKVLDGFQRALLLVGQEIMGRQPTRGPVPRSYLDQLSLELVSTAPGSFSATLALPEPPTDQLVDIGEDALEKVIRGIDREVRGDPEEPLLPAAARLVIRETVLSTVGPGARLTFQGGRQNRIVVISEADISNLPKPPTQPLSRRTSRLVGRLLEVDFKDGTAEIYDASGGMTRIRFSEDFAERIKGASRMQVVAEGEAEIDEQGKQRAFDLVELASIDIADEFWGNPSLDELVRQQGVQPIISLVSFGSSSFDENEADELIAELRSFRR